MDYEETIGFLYSSLPVYHRVGQAAYKADLATTLALDDWFGHPHRRYRTIHVAGTNGKGSVSHMLASVLMEEGYTTGLYTSPHLRDFRERIRVNGKKIPEKKVVKFVEDNTEIIEKFHPSFFEITAALAFQYFADEQVDVAIIETGMGGRLDSTNIITPELSVITNIGLDHTRFLGDTIEEIAGEKAGIIKRGVPVVAGKMAEKALEVIQRKSAESGSDLFIAGEVCRVTNVNTLHGSMMIKVESDAMKLDLWLKIDIGGLYEAENAETVIGALAVLKSVLPVTKKSVTNGLQHITSNTGLEGRWQITSTKPLTICDVAHNSDGLEKVISQLNELQVSHIHFVIGFVNDKDISVMLALLPDQGRYYFTETAIPRALPVEDLSSLASEAGLRGKTFATVREAVLAARSEAGEDDMIYIGGSTFIVAEYLEEFLPV